MAEVPIIKSTKQAIFDWWASQPNELRPTLGASELGVECERAAWFKYRWFKNSEFEPRMLRLFDHGKKEEQRVFDDLKNIGVQIESHDVNGNQYRFSALDGNLTGSFDAAVKGLPENPEWHVLEIKTHNDKSFKDLQKNGVKKSKYRHYVQMQVYMGFSDIPRACYFAVNKNDDDLYIQFIDFDKYFYSAMLEKAKRIINSNNPLAKIDERPSFFVCKMCEFNDVCHLGASFMKNCRTCVNSKPDKNGNWFCNLHKKILNVEEQLKGCDKYEAIKIVPKRSD